MIVLIHPPVIKPSEPPPGIARLAGLLSGYSIPYHIVDANMGGLFHMFRQSFPAWNTRTRLAVRNCQKNMAALQDMSGFKSIGHYRRIVSELDHVLAAVGREHNVRVGLGNYQDHRLSPQKSEDLLKISNSPEMSPFFSYFNDIILPIIEDCRPDIIGISVNFLSQALCAFSLVGFLKKRCPGIRIILGGGLITSWMRSPGWRHPFSGLVDACVAGKGESFLLSLYGRKASESGMNGYTFDGLPLTDYLSPGFILPFATSSGCYWSKCRFCPEAAEQSPFYMFKKEDLHAELHRLSVKYKPVLIHFVDNCLTPVALRYLIDNPPGTAWYGYVRFSEELENVDFCRALKHSGCVMLKLGLESGNQEVLDQMDKGISLSSVSKILHNIRDIGIATYIYLLFGTPCETVEEARQTMAFVESHSDCIGFINPAIFNLPVSSSEAQFLETKPFFTGDLSLYVDFKHPKGFGRKEVRRFLDREFKRRPVIASILRRNPTCFTSNHASFFVKIHS